MSEYWVDRIRRKGEVAEPNWVVHKTTDPRHPYLFWCPACGCCHFFDDRWIFNGDMIKPTLTAGPDAGGRRSIWTQGYSPKLDKVVICHFNIDNGLMIYHNDCDHEFKSRTVKMETF